MIHYPDASLLVRAFTNESGSEAAEAWFTSIAAGQLRASAWCLAEAASALSTKVRTGELMARDRLPLFNIIRATLGATAVSIAIEAVHFETAADLLLRSFQPLRGGDALHLAIAACAGAKLWTVDRRMAEAGQALGLDVELLR